MESLEILKSSKEYELYIYTSYITGHSAANEEIAEQAAKKGATFITHLFNAMLPVSCMFVNILKLQLRLLLTTTSGTQKGAHMVTTLEPTWSGSLILSY